MASSNRANEVCACMSFASANMRNRRPKRGFSLVEVLVVIAVMGLMVGTLVIGFGAGRSAEVSRATTQLANTIRYGFDKARVTGDYYRLLIDIDGATFVLQQADNRMYLPATTREGKILKLDQRKLEEQAERDKRAEEAYNRSLQAQVLDRTGPPTGGVASRDDDDDKQAASNAFDPYAPTPRKVPRRKPPLFQGFEDENAVSGLAKPIALPEGMRIVSVRTADDLEKITKGQAGIYMFPQGRTQLAHVQIEDEQSKSFYTVKVQPLTGRVTIVDELEDLRLPDDPRDEEDELGRKKSRRSF